MDKLDLQARMKMYEELVKAGKSRIQLSEKFATTVDWNEVESELSRKLVDLADIVIEGGGIGPGGEALATIDIEYEGGNIHFSLRADHSGSHMRAGKKSLGYKIVNDVDGLEAFIRELISGKDLNEALKEVSVDEPLSEGQMRTVSEYLTDARVYIEENRFAPAIDRLTNIIEMLKKHINLTEDVNKEITVEVDGEVVADTANQETAATDVGSENSTPSAELGLSEILMQAVKDEYSTIQFYNELTATANEHGRKDIAAVISHINEEENIHVGQLQYCIQQLSQQAEKVEDGKVEAEEIVNNVD